MRGGVFISATKRSRNSRPLRAISDDVSDGDHEIAGMHFVGGQADDCFDPHKDRLGSGVAVRCEAGIAAAGLVGATDGAIANGTDGDPDTSAFEGAVRKGANGLVTEGIGSLVPGSFPSDTIGGLVSGELTAGAVDESVGRAARAHEERVKRQGQEFRSEFFRGNKCVGSTGSLRGC